MWKSFSLFAVVANANPSWETWKAAHGRNYLTAQEEAFRHSVFTKNMDAAAARNEIEEFATFGADEWSDWTEEEFSGLMGYVPQEVSISEAPEMNVTDVPNGIDWTGKATTSVKNQGSCGSCWAFSAVEQIESDYILQQGKKVVLAPQELVDCKGNKQRRNGCQGGDPTAAYKVVEQLGGIEGESDYRYTARNGNCRFSQSKVKVKVTSSQRVGRNDENAMKKYVGSTGPLSVCVDANSWHSYRGGILTSCGSSVDHCTQVVGYGESSGKSYWKVRNSWGTGFGESGFIRIQIGRNLCRIASEATKTTVKSADESIIV